MDRTLTDMFGAEITQAIFSYLEDKYGIKKGTMVPHFDKLLLAFRETFGEGVLGLAVAKRFYAELGLRFNEQPTYVLHDYVKEAKSLLAKGKADH